VIVYVLKFKKGGLRLRVQLSFISG